jgi:L-ascorbate metabolism protein UlaG (beta-lactamase superfamily)
MIMKSLDRLICSSVKHAAEGDRPKLKPWLRRMVPFYRRRIDCGLDALAAARVEQGIHIFKFYSSSVVLKSARGTVALDFSQGPIQNGGEPETSDLYDSGFYLTPSQRDRLAALIDVALITHRHHDHADYSLARRLVAAGKPVVGPAQLKKQWPALAHGITVPEYNSVQEFGPCEILTQFGYQYATRYTGTDGQQYGTHDTDAIERSSETVRYLLRMGQITFLQSAESQTEAYDWLTEAGERRWNIDVLFKPGQYQGARAVMRYLEGHTYFHVPIHEYELMHHGGGNRTAPLLEGSGRKAFDRKRSMPLLWGEDYLITLPIR